PMLVPGRAAVLALEPDQAAHRPLDARTARGHVGGCDRRCCYAANAACVAGTFLWTRVHTLGRELVRPGHALVRERFREVALISAGWVPHRPAAPPRTPVS